MIEVLQSGTRASLQDAGRPGHRHLGIPSSGAADRLSFALANWMTGNHWDAPAIECTLGGQHFRIKKDTVIALAGAEMWAQINGQNVKNFTAFPVKAGDILTLSFARKGCRAYLGIAGGFKGEAFLGSVSTYPPACIGGLDGFPLKAGDIIEAGAGHGERRIIPPGYTPGISTHVVLRARPGPEFFDLSLASQRHLFISPFHATDHTDRMGSRLKGDRIQTAKPISMTSGPMLSGTLQVPAKGGPILSLVDGHCTGGYPRVIQVIRADFWQMGQISPGTKVSFQRSFIDDPAKILTRRNAFYGGLMDGFAF
ncbi:MAG: biotin-dependent carboxyltransferase family protein [Alphaproteobacteria bacterium]